MRRPFARRVVVRATGDQQIRATHAKTLELTGESTITARATCVVGVDASLDPIELGLLRGAVDVSITAGGHGATGRAVINPEHTVTDRLVLRRSDRLTPETLAVHSTLTAVDLDRDLVAAMADPESRIAMTLTEAGQRQPLVIVGRRDRPDPAGRLGLLWRNPDATVDLGARHLPEAPSAGPDAARRALDRGGVVAAVLPGALDLAPPAAVAWFAEAARRGARFAVLDADRAGSAPAPMLLAAGLPTVPVLWLGRVDGRALAGGGIASMLRSAPVPTVFRTRGADVDALAGPLTAAAGDRRVAVSDGLLDVGVGLRWLTVADALSAIGGSGTEENMILLPGYQGENGSNDLQPVVRALLDAGVSARTLTDALRPFGLGRREVYDAMGGASRPRPS